MSATENNVMAPTSMSGAGGTISSTLGPISAVTKRCYGPVLITLENVVVPPDKINPSPSAIDGLDDETEMYLRVGGCELIQTSGILLKLPQTAMATGQVLFQRFYYSKSFVRQPMEVTAMACVYLASKIEEAPRRIRDVINVFHHIRQIRAGKLIQPLILDPSYVRLKNDVTLAERRVLKELGFCVHVKHPHKIIVIYLQQLNFDQDRNFVQMSWNYMNDALRTNVFVQYSPEAIACACIFLSARILKIPLPSNPAWFAVFDVTEEQVSDISKAIVSLYERPPINYEELENKVDVIAKAYQEMREKGKSTILCIGREEKASSPTTPNDSKPSSPASVTQIPEIIITDPSNFKGNDRLESNSSSMIKSRKVSSSNGEGMEIKRKDHYREESPPPVKKRRTPSPIIFHNYAGNRTHRSRPDSASSRHKQKKRKKSKYSPSRSRSRSRSRDRRSSKKVYRTHSRSPVQSSSSGYKEYYGSHSKKSEYRDRDRERLRDNRTGGSDYRNYS